MIKGNKLGEAITEKWPDEQTSKAISDELDALIFLRMKARMESELKANGQAGMQRVIAEAIVRLSFMVMETSLILHMAASDCAEATDVLEFTCKNSINLGHEEAHRRAGVYGIKEALP